MAYQCPRCGHNIKRGSSTSAVVAGGLVGSLLYSAMADFECRQCGTIMSDEFPPEVRREMKMGSWIMIASGALVAMIAIVALVWIQSIQ